MGSRANNTIQIEGTVAAGFESVEALYRHNMRHLMERNTQLCVYHRGEKVVDLWATAGEDNNFSADSLVNVFSSGKSLEAIAIATLAGKGLLDYKAKVSDYWPEFSASGKGELTVAQLMRHEAGLASFNVSIEPDDLLTENIKRNKIGSIIEAQGQSFPEGSDREYHAITRGWIINELFRRVDPTGRTIGEFLRQDISEPLQVDAIIGVKESELARIVKVTPLSMLFQFIEGLNPKFCRRMEHNIFQLIAKFARLLPLMRKSTGKGAPAAMVGMTGVGIFNEPAVAMGETPSAGAKCSARGLAKIAAMMSAGGSWGGVRYLSQQGWNALHDEPQKKDMGFSNTTFTQGGVAQFVETTASSSNAERAFNAGREGFYGWMGLGGSIFQWHSRQQIGFGYVPTSLNVLDLFNERGKTYQAEVLSCVQKLAL